MSFASFWADLLATVVGGVVLAVLFFLAKERLFPLPKLTGRWYLEQTRTDNPDNGIHPLCWNDTEVRGDALA